MDGVEANVRIVLPDGLIWQDFKMVNTEHCEVKASDLDFSFQNSRAFLSQVEYNLWPGVRNYLTILYANGICRSSRY
jgi:hypothetical protein